MQKIELAKIRDRKAYLYESAKIRDPQCIFV